MKSKWLIIAALFPLVALSQENSTAPRFNIIASAGVIAGESAAKPLFQVVTGVKFNHYFAGVGAGLDLYDFKSVPVFVDGRVSFGKSRLAFAYANGGYNFPYDNEGLDDDGFYKTSEKTRGGFYMDAGLGYRIRLNTLHRLAFSAGYSQKNINYKTGYTYPCINPPCPEEVYTYHYNLGRIVTKLSWEFGK